jgi:23S rRNA (uracil1939-C5)-methyltransferase
MTDDNETYRVEITDIAHGGDGVGRLPEGLVVFVPRTIPGEEVDIEVTERKPNFARGRIVDIHETSDERVESDCPYFSECGGCQFWHMPYDREVDYKTQSAFETIERLNDAELPEPDIVEAPSDRRYRSRVRFHRRRTGGEEGEHPFDIGFFGQESHDLVSVEDCPISADTVNRARRQVEEGVRDVGDVELLVETADEDSAVLTIVPQAGAPEDPPESFRDFADDLSDCDAIRGVRFVGDDRDWVGGDASVDGTELMAEPPVETIRIPAGLFRQANPEVNPQLVDAVREAVDRAEARQVLELFCGVGNISFGLRDTVEALLGFEIDETAVEMAETMAKFAGHEDMAFLEADLSEGLPDVETLHRYDYDTVVLDPPRGGAPDVCCELADVDAETIVYISCAPAALGRDLATLEGGGWRAREMTMFDMFPRTSHVEVLTILERP